MDNEELIPLVKSGDKKALEQLYGNNMGMIRKLSYKYSNSEHEREDLQQEAYFVICNCVKRYDPQHGNKFITYFNKAFVWHIARYKTNRGLKEKLYLDSPLSDESDDTYIDMLPDNSIREPTEALFEEEVKRRVSESLDRLPEVQAGVTFLYYGEELSIQEVAEYYRISVEAATKERITGFHKLRRDYKLRRFYHEYCDNQRKIDILSKAYDWKTEDLATALVDQYRLHQTKLLYKKIRKEVRNNEY